MTSHILPADLDRIAARIADAVAEKLSSRQQLVDRHTLADIIGLSVSTIDRRIRDGSIPAIRTGNRVLFDPAAVVHALSNGESADAKNAIDPNGCRRHHSL